MLFLEIICFSKCWSENRTHCQLLFFVYLKIRNSIINNNRLIDDLILFIPCELNSQGLKLSSDNQPVNLSFCVSRPENVVRG